MAEEKKPVSEQLRDAYIVRAVLMSRYAEHLRERLLVLFDELRRDTERQLFGAGINDAVRVSTRMRRMERLLGQLEEGLSQHYKGARKAMKVQLFEFSKTQATWARGSINAIFNFDIGAPTLNPTELRVLVDDAWVVGTPSADWWKQQEANALINFKREVRLGVVAGETTEAIVNRLRGKDLGKRRVITIDGEKKIVPDFQGGVLNVSTAQATALTLTALNAVGNQVNYEVINSNRDILRGYQALATLDMRTTLLCISRDGSAWDFDGNALPESPVQYHFPGPPPWHFRCRTVLVPVIKRWVDLIEESTGVRYDALENMSEGERASMDGTVAADMTYEKWLKKQSTKRQIEALGPARHKLWKAGRITAAQLADQTGRALSVLELQSL